MHLVVITCSHWKYVDLFLSIAFILKVTPGKRRVLDLSTLTGVGGRRDGDCGDKQTHAVGSLGSARALLRRFDSTGWLSGKLTFTGRAAKSEPGYKSRTLPEKPPGFLSPSPSLPPSLPPSFLRSRLMWHINVPAAKRAKHDGAEEARRRRRRPWQHREYQRQGKLRPAGGRDAVSPLRPRPRNKFGRLLSGAGQPAELAGLPG